PRRASTPSPYTTLFRSEGVLAAGALAATTPLAAAARSRTRGLPKRSPAAPRDLVSHGRFGSGVASGLPQLDGAPLWTRVDGIDRDRKSTRLNSSHQINS